MNKRGIRRQPKLEIAPTAQTLRRVSLVTGMIASFAGMALIAQSPAAMPDAQIEANVLKALAGAPNLANESITTRTVYGVVTLTGNVHDDAARIKADDLAAGAAGVIKVVDRLQVDANPSSSNAASESQQGTSGTVLQSDGTFAPAAPAAGVSLQEVAPEVASSSEHNDPGDDPELKTRTEQRQEDRTRVPRPSMPDVSTSRYPPQPVYRDSPNASAYGGKRSGEAVIIPIGTMMRVRINRLLASDRVQPGQAFDGIVSNDVVANGFIAIPRGATVQGDVVDAKPSGTLKGRGEMSIQLTSVTLAGRVYPIVSDVWSQHGGDKTIETLNKTAGFGAVGALIGAIAGGGVGAAVGGGIGAAAGLGSSAASGRGQTVVPPEGIVTFHLVQAAEVRTVSEQEMQRLAYGTAPGVDPRPLRTHSYPRPYPLYPRYPMYPMYPGYPAYPPYPPPY